VPLRAESSQVGGRRRAVAARAPALRGVDVSAVRFWALHELSDDPVLVKISRLPAVVVAAKTSTDSGRANGVVGDHATDAALETLMAPELSEGILWPNSQLSGITSALLASERKAMKPLEAAHAHARLARGGPTPASMVRSVRSRGSTGSNLRSARAERSPCPVVDSKMRCFDVLT